MPMHRFSLEFEATVGVGATSGSKSGWTEQWYDPANRTDAAAAGRALNYMEARRTLLTPGWTITALRVTQLSPDNIPNRKGQLVFLPPARGVGQYGAGLAGIDEQPYDAINIALASAGGSRRAFLMRGIGNDVINAGGRFVNPFTFNTNFPGWVRNLTGGQAGPFNGDPLALRVRDLVSQLVIVAISLVPNGFQPGTTPLTPCVRVTGPVVPAGLRFVNIRRVAGMSGLNGTWGIQSVTATAGPPAGVDLLLESKRRTVVSGTPTTLGVATGWRLLLDNIILGTAGYGASRRTGRPPQLTRGRRSNRG